jgi:serine/threonine protein kinase
MIRVQRDSGLSPSALGGRYELGELIGSGGMAAVWRARDTQLKRDVAIKVLAARFSSDESFRRRFEREARHVASLSNPYVVSVYDFGVDGDKAYIVMELVTGHSLRSVLDSSHRLSVIETASYAIDVLSGLGHAHNAGIVHRDVKPGNILISNGAAKLADFGIARSASDTTEIAAQGLFLGTIVYSSPELLMGREVGPRSDLYSLACVLYECLTGAPPFHVDDTSRAVLQHRFAEPRSIEETTSGVPKKMSQAIMYALSKEPNDRFESAEVMRREFEDFAPERPARLDLGVGTQAAFEDVGLKRSRDNTTVRNEGTTPTSSASVGQPSGNAQGRSQHPMRWAYAAAALVLVAVATIGGIYIAKSPGHHGSGLSSMVAGDTLLPGQSLTSPNQRFELTMQSNGDLVTSEVNGDMPTWATGSVGHPGAYAVVQGDGNFIVYPKGKSAPLPGRPTSALWQSQTNGHPGATLTLLNSGNLVLLPHNSQTVLWQSGAIQGNAGSQLLSNEGLHPGQYLQSPNGEFQLINAGAQGVLRLYATTVRGEFGHSLCRILTDSARYESSIIPMTMGTHASSRASSSTEMESRPSTRLTNRFARSDPRESVEIMVARSALISFPVAVFSHSAKLR